MEKQSRKQRFANIRISLKEIPVIQATSLRIEEKIQKRQRRNSIQYGEFVTIDLDNFSSDCEDTSSSLFHERYDLGEKAGEGAHGVVRQCIDKKTGDILAVKTLTLQRQQLVHLKKNFTEIKSLLHPNILRYRSLYFELKNARSYLVMDYFPHPQLINVPIKSEQQLRDIAHQLFSTLKYLHSCKICHRDIKPENILYDRINNCIKIIDFGISKKVQQRGRKRQMLTLTGTPYYRAPEMFEGGGYDHMVDLWAAGITLYKLMTGKTPFQSQYHSETINRIRKDEVMFPEKLKFDCSTTLKRLVKDLLTKDRKERPTAEQALNSMWFLELRPRDQITKSMNIWSQGFHDSLTHSAEGISTSDGSKKVIGSDKLKECLDSLEEADEIFGYEEGLKLN